MYYILDNFIPICEEKGDIELANKYKMINLNLKKALNVFQMPLIMIKSLFQWRAWKII